MKFKCPFQMEDHVGAFNSPADYILHLQKCHLINTYFTQFGETRNEYYFCSSCLQVFELITDRDRHQQICTQDNFKHLFKDVNKPIPLGKSGKAKLQSLIIHYKEIMNPKIKNFIDIDKIVENFQEEIPGTTDPRLYVPRFQKHIPIQNIQKAQKLSFILLGGHAKMEAAYYKLFNLQNIEQINKEFPFKITQQVLKTLMTKNKINLSKQMLQETKVCEFSETKIDQTPDMYLQIISNKNSKSIWLMIPEVHNPVPEYEFDEPWCIFNFIVEPHLNTQQFIEHIKVNPIIDQLEKELKHEEQIQAQLKQSLQQSQADYQLTIQFNAKKESRIDKLGDSLLNLTGILKGKDSEFMHLQIKYVELSNQKLQQAETNLNSFYVVQKELEIQKHQLRSEEFNQNKKKKENLSKIQRKIQNLQQIRLFLIDSCTKLQDQVKLTQVQIEEKLAKASVAKRKIQMIKQLLCIQCKIRERTVLQFPCQHFLFCEECFVQNQKNLEFKCPLNDLRKCKNENLSKKYKLVKIGLQNNEL